MVNVMESAESGGIILWSVIMFKGRDGSRYSFILNCKFCACVMRIRGVPQLQVIYIERLYGCKWHLGYDRCLPLLY